MSGVYREKTCPTCGVKHRKKGPFCSKVCSNKGRDAKTRSKLSANAIDQGLAQSGQLAQKQIVEPPDPNSWGKFFLDTNQFVDRDGDIWTSDNSDPW